MKVPLKAPGGVFTEVIAQGIPVGAELRVHFFSQHLQVRVVEVIEHRFGGALAQVDVMEIL